MSCPWEGDGRCENPVFQKLDEAQAEVERLRHLVPPEVERSSGGVSQGTWSVFAEKVVKERDEAKAEVVRLNASIRKKMGIWRRRWSDAKTDKLRAEVERLTKERDEMMKYLDVESVTDFGEQFECHLDESQRVREENAKLSAEVERLRGMLMDAKSAMREAGACLCGEVGSEESEGDAVAALDSSIRDIEEALRGQR